MIREARKEDAEALAPLIMVILEDMELEVFKEYSKETIEELLVEGIQTETYRYSYRHAHVCMRDGEIAGVVFGYRGEKEPVIDEPLIDILEAKGLNSDSRLFIEKETFAGEWYLDSLVTAEKFRGRGVGTELLDALGEFAKEDGEEIIGLNCDQSNAGAQKLYEKMGFKKTGEVTISGHEYNHMQKQV